MEIDEKGHAINMRKIIGSIHSCNVANIFETIHNHSMEEDRFLHGMCHFNNGSCDKYCMMFTETEAHDACKICGHLKQFHEVGHIFYFTVITTEFKGFA